jgi:Ca2+-binding RTX toxin-like protein
LAFTTVTGSNGVTSLVGTSGIDVATIVTLASKVFVGGQQANDTIQVNLSTGSDVVTAYTVNGGAGDDTISSSNTVLDSIFNGDGGTGVAGNDTITFNGLFINSQVNAGGGNDTINGNSGFNNSSLDAGDGNDVISVSSLNSSNVLANNGNDVINLNLFGGSLVSSTVNGNAGDDSIKIKGDADSSFIYGGQGTDTIMYEAISSNVLINGNKGSDTITINSWGFVASTVYGGQGNDKIDAMDVRAVGGATLLGTAAGATLSGDFGDDTVYGTNGIDTISGGDGEDSIRGSNGGDVITGGMGSDVFDYFFTTEATVNGNTGFDTITDFVANTSVAAPFNGDRFRTNSVIGATNFQPLSGLTSAGTDLQSALASVASGLGANSIGLVSLAAGTSGASYAGNYMIIGNAVAGYQNNLDGVVKLNTLAGITAATFFV